MGKTLGRLLRGGLSSCREEKGEGMEFPLIQNREHAEGRAESLTGLSLVILELRKKEKSQRGIRMREKAM